MIGDNVSETQNPLIMRAKEDKFSWEELNGMLDQLSLSNDSSEYENSRIILKKIVTGFKPEGKITDILYNN